MTVTLEAVKARHEEIGMMIATLVAKATRTISFAASTIELREGEHYAGIVLGKDGEKSHHLILLPGEVNDIKWDAACGWAAKTGGELPKRCEQALLYANLKEQFQGAAYWSGEQHADDSGYAWRQDFSYGHQYGSPKDNCLRARAVRRLPI